MPHGAPYHSDNFGPVSQGPGHSVAFTLTPLTPLALCERRYAVKDAGREVGRITKVEDSFSTQFPWRAWAGNVYLGEFGTWQNATTALKNYENEN